MAKRKNNSSVSKTARSNGRVRARASLSGNQRTYTIVDYRLEKPHFRIQQARVNNHFCYQVTGDLSAPVVGLRESKYLGKKQLIEIYRWMLLNRQMEIALENLYKQGKVVGGVYFGLGQEACSCASAYALGPEDWMGPMIRNQGSLLVRGFSARDIMMQYMAKAGSPTHGRDASSHFGDIEKRNVVSPISTLGDLIPVMAGVALGARDLDALPMEMGYELEVVRLTPDQAARKATAISRYRGEVPRLDDLASRLGHPTEEFQYEVLWRPVAG